MISDVAFWVFGLGAVWFGVRVFVTDSMVRATYSLLASFLNVGAIMLLLLGQYLGVALFFMMAVEMVVMALFMVAFMMNPAGLNPMQMVHQHRWSLVAGVATFAGLATVVFAGRFPDREFSPGDDTLRALGSEMMGGSMLIMQTVGLTLLATMVGASVLAIRGGRFGDADEGSLPPALEPGDEQRAPEVESAGHAHHHGHGGDS